MRKLLLPSLFLLSALLSISPVQAQPDHYVWTEETSRIMREAQEQEYREESLRLQRQIEENTDRTGFCYYVDRTTVYCP